MATTNPKPTCIGYEPGTSLYKVATTQGVQYIQATSAQEAASQIGKEAGKSAFVSKAITPKTEGEKKAAERAGYSTETVTTTSGKKVESMFSPAVAAAREYVRLYGPLPESGAGKSVIEAYQAETGKIQEAMKAGTYEPPPNIIAGVYDIKTQRGIKKFVATDEAQVKRLAESHGLIVGGIKKIKDEKLTPYEAVKRMTTAQQRGEMSAAEALITYGGAFTDALGERYFGEGYEPPPKDNIPVRTS